MAGSEVLLLADLKLDLGTLIWSILRSNYTSCDGLLVGFA